MDEDDLVFLGAAILLAPRIGNQNIEASESEIEMAVARSFFLRQEVKRSKELQERVASSQPISLKQVLERLKNREMSK